MSENPYQSPTAPQDRTSGKGWKRIGQIDFGAIEAGEFSVSFLMVLAASLHRLLLFNLEAYRTSPLIFVEAIGLLILLSMVPFALLRAIFLMTYGRPARAVVNILAGALAIGAIVASVYVDAPTLLYGT